MLARLPVMRLSTQMTSCPSARKRSHRCEPMNPAPPVMTVRMRQSSASRRDVRRTVRRGTICTDTFGELCDAGSQAGQDAERRPAASVCTGMIAGISPCTCGTMAAYGDSRLAAPLRYTAGTASVAESQRRRFVVEVIDGWPVHSHVHRAAAPARHGCRPCTSSPTTCGGAGTTRPSPCSAASTPTCSRPSSTAPSSCSAPSTRPASSSCCTTTASSPTWTASRRPSTTT